MLGRTGRGGGERDFCIGGDGAVEEGGADGEVVRGGGGGGELPEGDEDGCHGGKRGRRAWRGWNAGR